VIKEEFDEQKRYRENIIDRIEYKEYYKAIYNAHYHIDEIVVGIVFFKSKKYFFLNGSSELQSNELFAYSKKCLISYLKIASVVKNSRCARMRPEEFILRIF
jgi:hypothetical protein